MTKVSKEPIRVLMIMPTLNYCGGIESVCINYITNMPSNIKTDIITFECNNEEYKKIIRKHGGQVFLFSKITIRNIRKFKNELALFFKKHHNYDIVHCNMANGAYFFFKGAKKHGINNRILHSHQNKYADKFIHVCRNYFLVKLGIKYTTFNLACSNYAGDFLFKNENYSVLYNSIDIKKYKFNSEIRKKLRSKLKLNNKFVIGHVGRFVPQKNHKRLIDIFYQISKKINNVELILVGNGEDFNNIKDYIKTLNLQDKVKMLGERSDSNNLYQVMDMFLLPSLYEGLPMVGVEAQINNLPCIFSDTITRELEISSKAHYLCNNDIDSWVNLVEKYYNDNYRLDGKINYDKFNILNTSHQLIDIYEKLAYQKENKKS